MVQRCYATPPPHPPPPHGVPPSPPVVPCGVGSPHPSPLWLRSAAMAIAGWASGCYGFGPEDVMQFH